MSRVSGASIADLISTPGIFLLDRNPTQLKFYLSLSLAAGRMRGDTEGAQHSTWRYAADQMFADFDDPFPDFDSTGPFVPATFLASLTHFQLPASTQPNGWTDKNAILEMLAPKKAVSLPI